MKKPICNFCNIPMEPSGQLLVKPGNPNRYITTSHKCPDCGKEHETPQQIIDNARRPPSPSKPKPKQRVAYSDGMKMLERINGSKGVDKVIELTVIEENGETIDSKEFIHQSVVEKIIRKLTRP